MIPGFGDISGGQGGISADLGATNGDFTGGGGQTGAVFNIGAPPARTNIGPVSVDNNMMLIAGVFVVVFLMMRKK